MNICKDSCSYDPNKLIELLEMIKSLYERLTKDVCLYAKELQKLQDYYQRFDLNNDAMLEVMKTRLEKLLILFYTVLLNHLSATTNVRGIGEKIIKPVKQEYGTSTTIKYQNICKTSAEYNGANNSRYTGCRDFMKIQTTINIATYDNISIAKIFEDNVPKGYVLTIGKLTYNILNYNTLELKHTVRVESSYNFPYDEVEKLTTTSIETLYEFVDNQIRTLGDVESCLVTNIEYVNKYLKKFKTK